MNHFIINLYHNKTSYITIGAFLGPKSAGGVGVSAISMTAFIEKMLQDLVISDIGQPQDILFHPCDPCLVGDSLAGEFDTALEPGPLITCFPEPRQLPLGRKWR